MRECSTKEMIEASPIKVSVYDSGTGEVTERDLDVEKLIERCDEIVERFMKIDKRYKAIGEFFNSIMWTFRVETAATDGIRIYFNPLFANKLISIGGNIAKEKRDELIKKGVDVRNKKNGFDMLFETSKCFLFVLIHECYHQLYRHIESAQHKDETRNAPPSIHDLANVCMDDEINRDIEIQFPEFKGITKLTDGCIEAEKYPNEIWSEIFDDKYKNGETVMPPPVMAQPPTAGGDMPGEDDNRHMNAPDDYKKGWDQAIADIKAGKIDPSSFQKLNVNPENFDHEVLGGNMNVGNGISIQAGPGVAVTDVNGLNKILKGMGMNYTRQNEALLLEFNRDEYNQGYNDCIQTWINSQQGGGGKGPKGPTFDNLEQPPMQGSGDGDGNSDDNQQGEQQQDGSGKGQSGSQQQQDGQQQQNGSGSGSGQSQDSGDRQNQNGGASDSEIDKMSGEQAAQNAQNSANKAQQVANQAQQKADQAKSQASQSGSAENKANADAAQNAANQAKSAADKAQNAASQAQQAAATGNDDVARQKAKEARDAANEAQDAANRNSQGQNGQNNQKQQGQGHQGQGQSKYNDRTSQDGTEKGSKQNIAGNLGDSVVNVSVGSKWGGSDLISKQQGMEISEEEGEPFNTEEINQSPEDRAKAIIKKNEQDIRDIGKGTSASMARILDKINEILSPSIINWKNLLAKLFKNAGIKEEEQFKMKKSRVGGSFVRADRFEKVNPRNDILPAKNSADVFYLIDNSGSISNRDLYRSFSEVLALECRKDMNIRKSALTYFSDDIDESKIRVWYKEDSKKKKMELMQQNGDVCGGTEIAKNVVHVTKLKKAFYSRNNPRTLIIVFTDAVDYAWDGIKNLPDDIKKRLIFIVLNGPGSGWGFDTVIPNILGAGISEKNIVPIDVTKDLQDD